MIYYFSALEIKKCAEFDWSSYFKKDRLYISNGLLTAFNTFDSIILIRQYIFLAVIVVPSKSKVFHFKWQKMDLCLSLRNKKKNSSEEQNGPHAHLVHRRELNASQLEYSGVCVYVYGFFSFEITTILEKHMNQNSHMDTINNHMHRKSLYQWFFF